MRDVRVSFPKPCDEKWETMTPAGCARICARCDKAIHDLSQYEFDEAEELLRNHPDTCVRACVDADGVVLLKPGRQGSARRMVVAAAVTAGLLAAGEPAFAKQDRPRGAVAGTVEAFAINVRVVATDQGGRTFRARVGSNGRYRIRHMPAGTYRLTFVPSCGDSWTVEDIVVADGETIVPNVPYPGRCIVVGMLRIEDRRG